MFKREDYAYVLEFLSQGRATDASREPMAQVVGEHYFTLLQVIIKRDQKVSPGEKIYIGRDERAQVDHIRGRINSTQLTLGAQKELETVVRKIVLEREAEFTGFLNRAGSINIRAHILELLPGVGKKHLQDLLSERQKKPFENFADVQARVQHMIKPEELFVHRILEELKGDSKYYLFTKPPAGLERDERERRY